MSTRWIDVVWTDLVGRAHVVRATRDACEAGELTVPAARVLAGFGDPEPGAAPAGELTLRADWSTERALAWDPAVSVCLADLHDAEGASPLCVRSFLRDVAAGAAAAGYAVRAAVELEFYLVDPATGRPIYSWVDNYNLSRVEAEPIVTAIRNDLRAMAVAVEASNPEYSGGQFEVNIAHADLLAAADQAVLVRLYTGVLARRGGLDATFLAKPWTDQSGSGVHVHQSLWREDANVFYGGHDELSAEGRAYLAGLLGSMTDFALLGSPTPNGYHRRADGSFAPTAVAWATDNRTAAVRAVLGSAGATRIEHRDGGADCDLYLTIGAQVLAGLDGLARGLAPPPPVTGNAYAQDLPPLPRTFLEAYDRLQGSELARRLLPAPLLAAYLAVLAPEIEALMVSSADWERARYAEVPLR
jgi:glutamine synthetase